MPEGWRTIKSLVHKIRLHGRRGKGMAESFSREKLRHAPQKEGGRKNPCGLPPVGPRLVRPTNLMSRMNGKKTPHTHSARSIKLSFFLLYDCVQSTRRLYIQYSNKHRYYCTDKQPTHYITVLGTSTSTSSAGKSPTD